MRRWPKRTPQKLELLQMDGGLFSGTALTGPTIIRLVVVVVLAIVVRHLVLRFGTKAIDKRRDKSRNGGKPPR
jgi:hypothetical protein